MKFINNKLFYFDGYGIEFIPDIVKKQYKKIITNIYRIQSIYSNECGKFCILFIKANIQNKSDYIKLLLQFHKNDFLKNDIKLYIMNTYCLKCKKPTKDLNLRGFVKKNKKYLVKSICTICKSKKSKFVSK